MNIFEIEKKFSSIEGMNDLLFFLQQEYFDRISYHADLFRGGALSDIGQMNSSLDELTGIYMDLKAIYMISITMKENRELQHYMSRKIEIENKGEKFTSAPIEKEASNIVANERRVRNIVEGFLSSCEKSISTIQSKLKFTSKEIELTKS
jgi:hypothetical protein